MKKLIERLLKGLRPMSRIDKESWGIRAFSARHATLNPTFNLCDDHAQLKPCAVCTALERQSPS
jgi:hypothetical protein